jgi:SAM-dependent methyltransferase
MKLCLACTQPFDSDTWRCPNCGHEPAHLDRFPAFAPDLASHGGGFRSEHLEELVKVEAGSFWYESRNRLILYVLRRFFPNLKSFLEIGCGNGFVLSAIGASFPHATLAGSEILSCGLAHAARRLPHAELFQMDARSIPFASHFDCIGAFDVLEHISEDERVLRSIHRALKPNGGILLTVPQHPWLWSHRDEMVGHVRRYTAKELKEKVVEAGFKIIFATSFVSFLLPLMWISRKVRPWDRDPCGANGPFVELKAGRWVNRAFGMVMGLECFMIQLGMRFPIGGSLLLAGKKR